MRKAGRKKQMSKIIFRIVGILFIVLFLAVAVIGGGIGYLTIREYSPDDVVELTLDGAGEQKLSAGSSFSVLTIDAGGVSGKGVPKIEGTIKDSDADVVFLQQVDVDSKRTDYVNQADTYKKALADSSMVYAPEFKCDYIPYPLFKSVGRMNSGLVTLNTFAVDEAERVALPQEYDWPEKIIKTRHAFLLERIAMEAGQQQLVLINVHLDSYEDQKQARQALQMLADIVKNEYAKGNYCIVGGNFGGYALPADDAYSDVLENSFLVSANVSADQVQVGDGAQAAKLLVTLTHNVSETDETETSGDSGE